MFVMDMELILCVSTHTSSSRELLLRVRDEVYTPALYVVWVSVVEKVFFSTCALTSPDEAGGFLSLSDLNIYTNNMISKIPRITKIPVYISSLSFNTTMRGLLLISDCSFIKYIDMSIKRPFAH
jgi:hypothetical protein